jgi:hypothetical protein
MQPASPKAPPGPIRKPLDMTLDRPRYARATPALLAASQDTDALGHRDVQAALALVREVRDEEAVGSNPPTPTNRSESSAATRFPERGPE